MLVNFLTRGYIYKKQAFLLFFSGCLSDGAQLSCSVTTVSYDEFQRSLHMPGLISYGCVCLQLRLNTSSTRCMLFFFPLLSSHPLLFTHANTQTHTHAQPGKAFNTLANHGPWVRFLEGDVYPQQCFSLRHVAWVNNTVKPKTMCVPDDCNYL